MVFNSPGRCNGLGGPWPFPGLSLDLTGVAPTILRHEGRLPLPPYVCRDVCRKVAMLFPGLAAQMRYSTDVFARPLLDTQLQFFPGGRAESFPRPTSGQEGQSHFREPLHTQYTSPVRNKLHTDGNHTHSTQLDTLKHTLRELGRQSALASPQPGFLERVPRYVT